MAVDPVVIALAADTWVKIADGVLVGTIYRRSTRPNVYRQTVRAAGGSAPTDDTDAVLLFSCGGSDDISSDAPIDVYAKAVGVAGEVRVDL